MTVSALRPLPPALPETVDGFIAHRKLKAKRTLNDHVEDAYLRLVENEKFQAFIFAVYDEQAVEGSLAADNIMAAEMIRDKAKAAGSSELASEKLATISKALGVVQRRYGFSRKERRNMVRGKIVPGDNG